MTTDSSASEQGRTPLTRDRILGAAIEMADADGIETVTMRSLATRLGVEAMSLYYHVDSKEALLDGMVELVIGEIAEAVAAADGPDPADDWKAAMRSRILKARRVLLVHRWAPQVIEQRSTMSPAIIMYYEDVLGILREGGFSYPLAHHALHALGSRALGFSQELFQPGNAADEEASEAMFQEMAKTVPNLVGMLSEIAHDDPDTTIGWCDDQAEFEFGLDILLDGLDRRLEKPTRH